MNSTRISLADNYKNTLRKTWEKYIRRCIREFIENARTTKMSTRIYAAPATKNLIEIQTQPWERLVQLMLVMQANTRAVKPKPIETACGYIRTGTGGASSSPNGHAATPQESRHRLHPKSVHELHCSARRAGARSASKPRRRSFAATLPAPSLPVAVAV